jgi:SAM-dependent methyltransferase
MHMVLHHAEDPAAAMAEAGRVLRPGGLLLIVDLAPHANAEALQRLAHRWPGFDDAAMRDLLGAAGLEPGQPIAVAGTLDVRLWPARRQPAEEHAVELILDRAS